MDERLAQRPKKEIRWLRSVMGVHCLFFKGSFEAWRFEHSNEA
jgi:hypothetical protein